MRMLVAPKGTSSMSSSGALEDSLGSSNSFWVSQNRVPAFLIEASDSFRCLNKTKQNSGDIPTPEFLYSDSGTVLRLTPNSRSPRRARRVRRHARVGPHLGALFVVEVARPGRDLDRGRLRGGEGHCGYHAAAHLQGCTQGRQESGGRCTSLSRRSILHCELVHSRYDAVVVAISIYPY